VRVSNSFWGHACPPDTTGLLNKWPLVRGKAKKKKKKEVNETFTPTPVRLLPLHLFVSTTVLGRDRLEYVLEGPWP
jgi:hypothetical protein